MACELADELWVDVMLVRLTWQISDNSKFENQNNLLAFAQTAAEIGK
jgi:hypothetical protein